MMKTKHIVFVLLGIVLLAFIASQKQEPDQLNWTPDYTKESDLPLGCSGLANSLEDYFPESKINYIEKSLWEANDLEELPTEKSFYIFINDQIGFSRSEIGIIEDLVYEGNTVLVSADLLDFGYFDLINLDYNTHLFTERNAKGAQICSGAETLFKIPKVKAFKSYNVDSAMNLKVHAELQFEKEGKQEKFPILISKQIGEGQLFLCCSPYLFSNYAFAKNDSYLFTDKLFSEVDNRVLVWDENYKAGKKYKNSPMRFILANDSLRWAWYILFFGLATFLLFKVKRTQRAIPVVEPPKNQALLYVEQIGDLYYEQRSNTKLLRKKIRFFKSKLKNQLNIDLQQVDEQDINRLTERSMSNKKELNNLMRKIANLEYYDIEISDTFLRSLIDEIRELEGKLNLK